jgi:hypothetical protein
MGDENTKEKIQAVLYVPQEVTGVYLPGPVLEGSHLRQMSTYTNNMGKTPKLI